MIRLLYIEDNPVDAETVSRMAGHIFDVTVEETLGDGVQRLKDESFDAVLLDLNLPDSSGIECLERCLEVSDLPVIVVTGAESLTEGPLMVQAGAQDYLPKSRLDEFMLRRAVLHSIDRQATTRRIEQIATRWSEILAGISETLVVVDQNHDVAWLNRPLFAAQDPASVLGNPVTELFDSEVDSIVANVFESGEPSSVEVHLQRRVFDCRIVRRSDLEHVVISVRDTTDERELAAQVVRSKRLAALGNLAGGVAHDFNNMLTVVMGLTKLVMEVEELSPEAMQDLSQVTEAGTKAAVLVDQLLTFANKRDAVPTTFDAGKQLLELEQMVRKLLNTGGLKLEIDVCDEPLPVLLDVGSFEQVIMNLVANANHALGGEGHIVIKARRVDSNVEIKVTDDGPGMSAEVKERLFEPFFTTHPEDGTGLGLSTVYGILDSAGGAIEVDSEEGVGSRFTISLPLHSLALEDSKTPEPATRIDLNGVRILVVEDQLTVQRAVKRTLSVHGAQVTSATQVGEALIRLRADRFDVVVSDVVLPGGSGRQIVEYLQEHEPDTPCVLMSGYTAEPVSDLVGRNVQFLAKPFLPEALLSRINSALNPTIDDSPIG